MGTSDRARPIHEELVGARYVRAETIGQGTLGTVHRARDVRLGRDVALKEVRHVFDYLAYLPRDEIVRKLREAVLAQAAMDHPFVLAVVDAKFDAEPPFVVLEHAAGGSLRPRLTRAAGPLPTAFVARWAAQTSAALSYAHARGVVHGDLKPENILFDARGNVKLTDFSCAVAIEKPRESGAPVYVGVGTPSYMAPEQLQGGAYGPHVDVYAVGILLYQAATGQLPGRRSPLPSQLNADVPAWMDEVFDRATRDAIGERPTIDEVRRMMPDAAGVLTLHEVDPLPPPAPQPPPPPMPSDTEATVAMPAPDAPVVSEA